MDYQRVRETRIVSRVCGSGAKFFPGEDVRDEDTCKTKSKLDMGDSEGILSDSWCVERGRDVGHVRLSLGLLNASE